jgi:hypothetical protein
LKAGGFKLRVNYIQRAQPRLDGGRRGAGSVQALGDAGDEIPRRSGAGCILEKQSFETRKSSLDRLKVETKRFQAMRHNWI